MNKLLLGLLLLCSAVVTEVEAKPSKMVANAERAMFLDIAHSGDALVAVGERGIILRSTNQGDSWQQVQSPVGRTLTSVFFLDGSKGWAVGHDETILSTLDGGLSWDISRFNPESENVYVGVEFVSAELGYVVGTNGRLLTSRDGGSSWQEEVLQVEDWYENHLFSRAENRQGEAVIAAEKGVIYRSTNNATDWHPVDSPYNGSFFGVLALPGDGFLIYGMSGKVFRSDDGGLSWQKVYTHAERGEPETEEQEQKTVDVESMMGGDFYHLASRATDSFLFDHSWLEDGRLVLVGSGGGVLISDREVSKFWTVQLPDRVGIAAVTVVRDSLLLARVGGGFTTIPANEIDQLAGITSAQ